MTLSSDRRATLIFNPMAGYWEWRAAVSRVVDDWVARGWEVQLACTEYTGHATELAAAAVAAGHRLVLAAGGDGTLNEVANALAYTQTILAPLPVGTGNSFTKELGLPRPSLLQPDYLLDASAALARGCVKAMDLGRVGDGSDARYWLLWASTGLDGFVVKQIEPRPRWFKRLGPAGYLARALFFLPQFNGVCATINVDDRQIEGQFLLANVSNCRMWLGGELRLNRRAVLDDGLFELWLFRGDHWPRALSYGLEISREDHVRNRDVTVLPCRRVEISTVPSMAYHLDGEPAGDTPFTATLCSGALRLLVPDTAPPDLFAAGGESLDG